jgi:hypothetical protein
MTKSELEIHYSTGEVVYAQLFGNSMEVDVSLDRDILEMAPTNVFLSSQREFYIINKSDLKVKYLSTSF